MKGFFESIGSKKVGIIGAGASGISAALFLKKLGSTVFLTERQSIGYEKKENLLNGGISFEEMGHSGRILATEMVVTSPGVPPHAPVMKRLERSEITVIDELELGVRFLEGKIIAVTGTNGKSTVTSWIKYGLREDAVLGGNIGFPVTSLPHGYRFYVLEVSSFQLERTITFRPHIAVILNVDRDHLDWHPDENHYLRAKRKIYKNQCEDDFLVLNYDDPKLKNIDDAHSTVYFFSLKEEVEGAYLNGEWLTLNIGRTVRLIRTSELKLIGKFNIENALAVAVVLFLAGVEVERIKETLKTFKGLPHRMELVALKNGVRYINDSKSTNPHSLKAALEALEGNIVLIAGGLTKELSFEDLKPLVKDRVKYLILIGREREKLRRVFKESTSIREALSLEEAVKIASEIAEPGDTVLLSPGCASFDMFKNYKERGEVFKNAVRTRILQMG